ncbi:MAG: tRNA (adenosine(37)-N6)-threonylcarbamoyltransferase complex dimerization subunit type 1 TsaB [Alphaproteobacteria bacterium]|nr:tRNA (adenosine(37)-N6)-threonylcarbamoyltransferase complex dimerization subunit type 1 TsaB [Alphaproteobacteria bacterium]
MRILAIDTALDACATALFDSTSSTVLAQQSDAMKRGHAEALMPMIARMMAQAQCRFTDLDRIAVTTGPGSFTGLRVGISAARGFALAANVVAVGVTTLAAFAAARPGPAPVLAAIDARHGWVYFQIAAGDGTLLAPPLAAPIDVAIRAAQSAAPLHLVGNAADLLAQRWGADHAPPLSVESRCAPDIGLVARLGAAADPPRAPPRPFYLRPPDATPAPPSFAPVADP